jgi:hypothetical protein
MFAKKTDFWAKAYQQNAPKLLALCRLFILQIRSILFRTFSKAETVDFPTTMLFFDFFGKINLL